MNYLLTRDQHEAVAFNAVMFDVDLPEEVAQSIAARGITKEATLRRVRAARGESESDEGTPEPTEAGSSGSGDDSGQDDGPALYSDEWFDAATVSMFQAELKKYSLPVTGKREELSDRLYEKLIDEGVITDDEEENP